MMVLFLKGIGGSNIMETKNTSTVFTIGHYIEDGEASPLFVTSAVQTNELTTDPKEVAKDLFDSSFEALKMNSFKGIPCHIFSDKDKVGQTPFVVKTSETVSIRVMIKRPLRKKYNYGVNSTPSISMEVLNSSNRVLMTYSDTVGSPANYNRNYVINNSLAFVDDENSIQISIELTDEMVKYFKLVDESYVQLQKDHFDNLEEDDQ